MQGNAEDLKHIPDESIDVYTIAFGIRNCTRIDLVLKEAHRVLRKGGRFLCLEFSTVQNPMFREFYEKYSLNVIPVMGEIVAGDKDSYKYLVESINKFMTQEELSDMMRQSGMKHCSHQNLTDGIVAIHSGWKL
jgi:2-methoxy-6-polyprenyl-1,4-benzoquinol methylase